MKLEPGVPVIVVAPGQYANSQLNGSTGVLLRRDDRAGTVFLTDGRAAGREWDFLLAHIEQQSEGDR